MERLSCRWSWCGAAWWMCWKSSRMSSTEDWCTCNILWPKSLFSSRWVCLSVVVHQNSKVGLIQSDSRWLHVLRKNILYELPQPSHTRGVESAWQCYSPGTSSFWRTMSSVGLKKSWLTVNCLVTFSINTTSDNDKGGTRVKGPKFLRSKHPTVGLYIFCLVK